MFLIVLSDPPTFQDVVETPIIIEMLDERLPDAPQVESPTPTAKRKGKNKTLQNLPSHLNKIL